MLMPGRTNIAVLAAHRGKADRHGERDRAKNKYIQASNGVYSCMHKSKRERERERENASALVLRPS